MGMKIARRDHACAHERQCDDAGPLCLTQRVVGATVGVLAATALPSCIERQGASRHRSHQARAGHPLSHTRDPKCRSESSRAAQSARAAAPLCRPSSRHQEPPRLNEKVLCSAAAAPAEYCPMQPVVLCSRVSRELPLLWRAPHLASVPHPASVRRPVVNSVGRSMAAVVLPRSP
eukprot:2149437-Prymnesium_polylepis.1